MHLTYHDSDPHTSAASAASAGEAGAPEIVITDDMTAAGIAALQDFNLSEDDLEWIVGSVFEAMAKAIPRGHMGKQDDQFSDKEAAARRDAMSKDANMQPTMNLRFVRRYADVAEMRLILQQQWIEMLDSTGNIKEMKTEWRDVPVDNVL